MNRIIGILVLVFGLTGLVACTSQLAMEGGVLATPAPVEPVLTEEPVVENRKTDCAMTGSDDGIGGTGCKVDAVD